MNQAKVRVVLFSLVLVSVTGCTQYHHGRPGGEPTTQEVVSEVKRLVEENVKDPAKANQVQALIHEIVQEVKRSSEEARGFHEQLAALNANYDAPPEEFTKILDQLNNARMESAGKILRTRFKIKELLTREEWKKLDDAMLRRVRNMRKARGQRTNDIDALQ